MSNRKDTKKKVNATAPTGRKGHQLPARAPDGMWSVLQSVAKTERRSVAQTVLILLEEALAARGHKLPSTEESEDE